MYTIDMQDIKNYLATLQEDDHVGTPDHREQCLVAKTLKHKYPGIAVWVLTNNEGAAILGSEDTVDFPTDVFEAAEKFDNLWPDYHDRQGNEPPITLTVLREKMPELFS